MANSLVPQGFQTSGQVSWDALGSSALSFSYGVLSRISRAGVDPYTLVVGSILGSRIRLAPKGRENVSRAVSKCTTVGTLGRIVQFGFGIESIAMTLSKYESGEGLMALCATLSMAFGAESAASILAELVKQLDFPDNFDQPSFTQWHDLVKSCEGVLAQSTFPTTLSWFWSKAGHTPEMSPGPENRRVSHRLMATTIATMLHLVSDPKLSTIRLRGLHCASWIAAVALWLFDFKIRVNHSTDLTDQGLIYTNCGTAQEPQVHVILNGTEQNNNHTLELEAASLLLEGLEDWLVDEDVTEMAFDQLPLESCLSVTLGDDLNELLKNPEEYGLYLGHVALVCEAISDSRLPVPEKLRHLGWNPFIPTSFSGTNLVEETFKTFPELTDLAAATRKGYRRPLSEVLDTFSENLDRCYQCCACDTCLGRAIEPQAPWNIGIQDEIRSQRLNSFTKTRQTRKGLRCRLGMILHIQLVIILLRKIHRAPELHFSRRGFYEFFRNSTLIRYWHFAMGTQEIQGIPAWALSLIPTVNIFKRPLEAARLLFTGQSHNGDEVRTCALETRGICVFLDSLCGPSTRPNRCDRVSVIPGRIECRNRRYEKCVDEVNVVKSYMRSGLPHAQLINPFSGDRVRDVLDWVIGQSESIHNLQLCAEDRRNQLRLHHRCTEESTPNSRLSCGPSGLDREISNLWMAHNDSEWPEISCVQGTRCKDLNAEFELEQGANGRVIVCRRKDRPENNQTAVILYGLSDNTSIFFALSPLFRDKSDQPYFDVRLNWSACTNCVLNHTMASKRYRPTVIIMH